MTQEKRQAWRQWLTLACFLLLIPVLIVTPNGAYHNWVFLAAYKERGIQTSGRIIRIKEQSGTRSRGRTVVIEHTPAGAKESHELWLEGWYINQLTHDASQHDTLRLDDMEADHQALRVGDLISVIYLAEQPAGRAILAADFEAKNQAPIDKLMVSLAVLAPFFGCLALRMLLASTAKH